MSAYTDFVQDFPARCKGLLIAAERQATVMDREVTLSLMAAAAGFVVPFERLRPPHEHPLNDRQRFPDEAEKLAHLLQAPFLSSCIWNGPAASWTAGRLATVAGMPDEWPELRNPKPLGRERKVTSVLKICRNALSHGNLFVTGHPYIERIIFVSRVSEKSSDFNFLQVSPIDFRDFLIGWFEFLESNRVPQELAVGEIESSA